MEDLWIAFCPIEKGEERSIRFHLSLSFVALLRCHVWLLDTSILDVIYDMYICVCLLWFPRDAFGLCLDFVIGSCGYFALANALQSFDSYVCPSYLLRVVGDSQLSCL